MAVIATNLLTNGSGTDSASYVTASISPTNEKFIILAISSVSTSTPPVNIPTVTGAGMTWTQFETSIETDNNYRRITLFRGVSDGTAGVLTISFSGETQLRCSWSITEFNNVDTSGTNGSNAIVQSAKTSQNDALTHTGITTTLSSFSSTNNATYGAVRVSGGPSGITSGSGFIELGEILTDGSDYLQTQFKNTNDVSVDWTWNSVISAATSIAVELKFKPSASFMMMF